MWELKSSYLRVTVRFLQPLTQACNQVLRFGGEEYIFRGEYFCFYYMFKTKFSGHNKIWEVLPLSVPSGYGPALTHVTTTLGLISSCLQRNITD